jgi:hypothetical protein
MPIAVESRRKSLATIQRTWPNAEIIDVTSKGLEPWVRFSPFYPHGGIPVPNSPGVFSQSVEGLWQGLKTFANADVDVAKFAVTSMSGIKRTIRTLGAVRGHRFGISSDQLLPYYDARVKIYLPAYKWVLEHRLTKQIADLRKLAEGTVILLDYETNGDIEDLSKPLSHASLVKRFIEDNWPTE